MPINRIGEYCEGTKGNINLPIEYHNNEKNLAKFDSGAKIAIATKSVWEAWGKPAICKTRLKLQLADGHLEQPLGLLEDTPFTICGIQFIHTFAVVDFGTKTAYDIILGQPFMRQLKMI